MKIGTLLISSLLIVFTLLTSAGQGFAECTAGMADGSVTVDGRPLLWKLRNQSDVVNDVHYFAAGNQHYPGLGLSTYSYMGMGPANDYPDGPVRQGINSEGLAVGWNVLDSGGWQQLHHQSLGRYNTIIQVRTYVNEMIDLSTYNYFIDSGGEASLWESQTGIDQHWEYNTRSAARDSQWIDVDNTDGDEDYSTGVDVSLSGWVVRANSPAHFNPNGADDLGNTGRYRAGRDVIGNLIYNNGSSTALSAKSIATSFFRHNTLARDDTVSNMIVHGVLPIEDPRLSTMWTLLGHSETGIFVPVWIHGVESGVANTVPKYLDYGDDGLCVYTPAKGIHNAGFNEADVQARTLPFEEHLFDVVIEKLLPAWRNRDWMNPAAVSIIGEEMKRVQERMDADAYWHLKYLYDNGASSNYAPTISIDSAIINGFQVTLSVTANDTDGAGNSELTYLFNYGDGQIGSSAIHQYNQAGHYLVSSTVTDVDGVSQTDWLFVTIPDEDFVAPTEVIVDNDGPGTSSTGTWQLSSGENYYGTQSVYSYKDASGTYTFTADVSGNQNVSMWWTWYSSRCSNVPVEIYDGNTLLNSVEVNQQDQAQASTWYDLGNYNFSGTARVVVLSQSSACSTCADAVSFVAGDAPDLDRIEIEGPASINENTSAQYNCRAYYTDGIDRLVMADSWSENSPYADISFAGHLTTQEVSSDEPVRLHTSYTEGATTKSAIYDVTITTIVPQTLESGVPQAGSVFQGEWSHYQITSSASDIQLLIEMTNLSDDVDLYVRQGSQPTYGAYECRPYKGGTTEEICTMTNSGATTWYVGVNGYHSGSYTITATLSGGGTTPGDPCAPGKVYDCVLNCVDQSTAQSWIGNGYCDDGTTGYDLRCAAFSYDGGDCGTTETCEGKCGQYNQSWSCQCDDLCQQYGDCCPDYEEQCVSPPADTCEGKCGQYNQSWSCQCDNLCQQYGDCCPDYQQVCP